MKPKYRYNWKTKEWEDVFRFDTWPGHNLSSANVFYSFYDSTLHSTRPPHLVQPIADHTHTDYKPTPLDWPKIREITLWSTLGLCIFWAILRVYSLPYLTT